VLGKRTARETAESRFGEIQAINCAVSAGIQASKTTRNPYKASLMSNCSMAYSMSTQRSPNNHSEKLYIFYNEVGDLAISVQEHANVVIEIAM
jgi:hypothetical protein